LFVFVLLFICNDRALHGSRLDDIANEFVNFVNIRYFEKLI